MNRMRGNRNVSIELIKNGAPQPPAAMVTTSWVRDDYGNGRRRYKVFAMHVPLLQAMAADMQLGVSHPRLAGAPTVIGEATLEVPNLEVAKMIHAALGEMLAKQPPEIQVVGSR
jgi:hypothetical protein